MSSEENSAPIEGTAEGASSDGWMIQTSKPRRLAPQCTLSRQDLGADNTKSKISAQETLQSLRVRVVKRFSKEELLAPRKPPQSLSEGSNNHWDIISLEPLEPVCTLSNGIEELLKAWSIEKANAAKEAQSRNKQHVRGTDETGKPDKNVWDISDGKGGIDGDSCDLDLADFSAAAMRFQTEMREMSAADAAQSREHEQERGAEVDILDNLIGESLSLETEDIQIPEWADYNIVLQDPDIAGSSLEFESTDAKSEMKSFDPSLFGVANDLRGSFTGLPSESIRPLSSPVVVSLPHHVSVTMTNPVPPRQPLWYYLDPQKHVQGPFQTSEMRNWLLAGYFQIDLPVRLNSWSDFHPLGSIFSSHEIAFLPTPPVEPGKLENSTLLPSLRGHTPDNYSQIEKVDSNTGNKILPTTFMWGTSSTAEQFSIGTVTLNPTRPASHAISAQAPVPAQIQAPDLVNLVSSEKTPDFTTTHTVIEQKQKISQTSSTDRAPDSASLQLKSVLGLATLGTKKASWGGDETQSDKVSFISIQAEQLVQEVQNPSDKLHASTSNTPAGWHVQTSNSQKAPALSLREIMLQEATTQSRNNSGISPVARGNSWAAKASNLSSGPSYTSTPVNLVRSSLTASTSTLSNATNGSRMVSLMNQTEVSPHAAVSVSACAGDEEDISDSGMSREFANWCATQLTKITGNKDLTLVKFCLSVGSTAEIREILAANLGSTPQVSNFATEFIKKSGEKANFDPRSKSDLDKKITKKKKGVK